MNRSRALLVPAIALTLTLSAGRAFAADPETERARQPMALGVNLDLFPTVISAVNGKVGYAPQVWLGIGHARLRLVGAHLEPPDGLAFADKGFKNPSITVLASIFDYTFGPHFDGPWVGAGFEHWQRSIEHDGVPGEAHWSSAIATLGGGYIWRFVDNFFLDPWAAVHATLNPETITLGSYEYEPAPISVSASVKVGWFVDI